MSIGTLRYSYTHELFKENEFLKARVGRDVEFFARITEEPDVRESSIRLTVLPVDVETNKPSGDEKIILITSLYQNFSYGDIVSVVGPLEKPENFKTNTGREFDYVSYLKKDDVVYQIFQPQINFVSGGHGNILKSFMLRIKSAFMQSISRVIREPHASLAGGILLGTKHSLGKDLQDDFRKAGLIHVVVLSGYNVTIVADFMIHLFSFLPKVWAGAFGALGIFCFAILTGGGATVVRASIMSLLLLIARLTGRTYDVLRALAVASCAMVFYNPHILLSDPSFQLSCMATFALIAFVPAMEHRLWWLPKKFQIRSCVASTLSTQLFLLPMLVFMTGMVSFVSIFTNLLVIAIIPIAMLMSFISGLFGFVSVFLAIFPAYIAYILLDYIFSVVRISVKIPFAYREFVVFSVWIVLVVYIVVLGWLLYNKCLITNNKNDV